MRIILACGLWLMWSAAVWADPLTIKVSDRDIEGEKLVKTVRRLTIQIVHDADRERRLIEFLKTQDLREPQPWLRWNQSKRKDGEVVTYTVFVNVTPGFESFRVIEDSDEVKSFSVVGQASLVSMQAFAGPDFRLKSLGEPILYLRFRPRSEIRGPIFP
ncbi:MAG: hypothetical protein WCL32_11335 [Planctomycetota bacterium]|jgi:hypothetical protein